MDSQGPSPRPARRTPLSAGLALGVITLSGALGLLPGTAGWFSAAGLLAWLALWALPAGFLAASAAIGRLAALPPLLWAVLGVAVGSGLDDPVGGVLAVAGLYALGFALGRLWPGRALVGAGLLLLGTGLLTALPSAGGALEQPWPALVTARLLDLSPVVWVFESAGVDWMRHPSVYELAGAGDLDPDLRVAWGGWRAALFFLAGASMAALLAARLRGPRPRT